MKKLCALLLISFSLHLYAENDRDDVLLYQFDTYSNKASIAGAEYLNPSTIFWDDSVLYKGKAYAVIGIKDRAFQNNSTLKTFWYMMNKGYIGERAFADCSNLRDFALFGGEELTIHSNAFDGCFNVSKIVIAADRLILNCGSSYSWYLPFTGCSGIDTVSWDVKQFDVPSSMDESLFAASKDHIIYFEFSENVGCVPNDICKNLSALEKVDISNKTRKIGERAFQNCIRLKSIIIPGSVLEVGKSAFEGCASLENLIIGNGVRKIERYAFHNCESLKSVIIPSTVTKIEYDAFSGCTNLQTVHIQSSPTMIEIGYSAIPSTTKVIFSDGTTMVDGVVQKKQSNTQTTQKQNLNKQTSPANAKKGLTKD